MPAITPAPDANPRKPGFNVPAGAVDSHFHAFGPIDRYPINPGSKYISEQSSLENYFSLQTSTGLERAVLVSGGAYGPNFSFLADALRAHPDRLRGVALLPEDVSIDDLKMLDSLGVRGARFASTRHGGVMPKFSKEIAYKVADLGWHIQFYPHADDFIEFAPLLLGLPNTVVLDHFASVQAAAGVHQPAFKKLLKMLDTDRVWVKVSGPMRCSGAEPPYSDVTPLAQALVKHSPHRLVWGTDWPHVNMHGRTMPNDGDLLDQLAEWVPSADLRHAILVDNPNKLYGFESLGLSQKPGIREPGATVARSS